MSIPDYIEKVREGDFEGGLQLLYETNPFSQVCGRICTHKCETSCAALHEGDAIAIRWLKRAITDNVPRERYFDLIKKPDVPASGQQRGDRRRRPGRPHRRLRPRPRRATRSSSSRRLPSPAA